MTSQQSFHVLTTKTKCNIFFTYITKTMKRSSKIKYEHRVSILPHFVDPSSCLLKSEIDDVTPSKKTPPRSSTDSGR